MTVTFSKWVQAEMAKVSAGHCADPQPVATESRPLIEGDTPPTASQP